MYKSNILVLRETSLDVIRNIYNLLTHTDCLQLTLKSSVLGRIPNSLTDYQKYFKINIKYGLNRDNFWEINMNTEYLKDNIDRI